MPTPADIALADLIVAKLNTDWAGQLTARRDWVPDLRAKNEIDTLLVSVVPGINPTGERIERDQTWETWPIDVGFAQRLTAKTREEIDGIISLVDEVRLSLQETVFVDADDRTFDPRGLFEFLARFDPELLNREEVDGATKYTGALLSVVRFEYLLLV